MMKRGAIIGVAFNTNKAERPFKGREREGEVGSVEDKEGGRRNSSLPEDSCFFRDQFPFLASRDFFLLLDCGPLSVRISRAIQPGLFVFARPLAK